jgi:glycosyltransferase involved in cell wall biosynthesis
MKVYYIGGGYEACYYARCFLPMVANGWDGDKTSMRKPKITPDKMMQGAMNADIIVYHRPIQKEMLESAILLKQAGKKIVLDNDDTYIKDSGVPVAMFKGLKDKMYQAIETIDTGLKEFAKIADLVTVTTETLAEEYRPYNNNVVILKNCIAPDDWEEPLEKTDKVRIGIVGSVASNKDYENIIPLLDSLKGREDVQLVLFALPPKKEEYKLAVDLYEPEFKFWEQYNPEWHHFVPVADYQEVLNSLKLDIMLIPRHDSYFNRAKSNIKFLEASMCNIATIAQSFPDGLSPYEKDGEYLILADTPELWLERTNDLIEDVEKRKEIAQKARQYVLQNYNIYTEAHLWEDTYKKLCEQ